MEIQETHTLNAHEKIIVIDLWNNEYPANLTYNSIDDFDRYLDGLTQQKHYLLVDDYGQISAWAFEFEREQEKWFAIIVDSRRHGRGYGTQLLRRLKQNNKTLNGWVIDHDKDVKLSGETYKSPISFYLKNNFKIVEDTRLELSNISAVKIFWIEGYERG